MSSHPVPTRRRRSNAGRRPAANTAKQELQILWALAIGGDINENHRGGNASKTFNARLKDLGVKIDSKDVYNRMYSMENRGWIERLTKDNKCYAIRLKINPDEVGSNPFEGKLVNFDPGTALALNGNGKSSHPVVPAEIAQLTIRERLEIATAIISGIRTELDTVNI